MGEFTNDDEPIGIARIRPNVSLREDANLLTRRIAPEINESEKVAPGGSERRLTRTLGLNLNGASGVFKKSTNAIILVSGMFKAWYRLYLC